MARKASATDFIVKVPSVGTFTFGRRKMGDEIEIQVEYARLLNGVKPTEWLEVVCGWFATFRTMIVRAPEDWDIDGMDPTEPETYAKMREVYEAFRTKEDSFRRKPEPSGEADGAGNGGDNRVRVPAPVQPDGQ